MLIPYPFAQPRIIITKTGEEIAVGTKHPLYRLRYIIMTRCYNPKQSDYNYYKAKGIKVCEQWRNNPELFFKWCLDNGWKQGLSLDRINPDGNYEPDNCQFLSNSDNLTKMHKQRGMVGEKAANAKLTQEQVDEIRRLLKAGVTCVRIAKDFSVSPTTITAIKSGQNWKLKEYDYGNT